MFDASQAIVNVFKPLKGKTMVLYKKEEGKGFRVSYTGYDSSWERFTMVIQSISLMSAYNIVITFTDTFPFNSVTSASQKSFVMSYFQKFEIETPAQVGAVAT